jgi:hypothetical protein
VASGADDAGGGEGFQEEALAWRTPAVGADLLRGGGERRELAGHGKALFREVLCREDIIAEGV